MDNTLISKTYDIDEEFDNIECDLEVSDLNIYQTTDSKSFALCLEKEKVYFDVEVIDKTLWIKENNDTNWLADLNFNANTNISLYLNKEVFDKLNIEITTGDVSILDSFTFKNININGSTSNLELMSVKADDLFVELSTGDFWINRGTINNVNIKLSTGDVEIIDCVILNDLNLKVSTTDVELTNTTINGDLNAEGKTGDLEMEQIVCDNLNLILTTGNVILTDLLVTTDMNIETTTGHVELNYCDAKNIYITTSTGKVEGTILTSKIFDISTESGNVNVPKTYDGGMCKIKTNTGDINILIE